MSAETDTVLEQIRTIAEQQLSPDYFAETTGGDAEPAIRKRIQRDDRYLLVCETDQSIRVVDSVDYLSRTVDIQGFSFFGSYTVAEMEAYMKVPFDEVFDRDEFPALHLRNITLSQEAQQTVTNIRLIRRIRDLVYAEAIDVAVVCLRLNDGVGTAGLVEAFGAQRLASYDNYADRWGCSACDGVCDCQFVFYKMTETDPDA